MAAARTARWTKSEIALLREFYPNEGIECVKRLPGRTWRSLHQKAFKLGIACEKSTGAPKPRLQGDDLEEAIRLREDDGWSFARIGAKFGVAESSACNAVLIALCPRKGFTPAERDENGRISDAGLERLRYALKKGLKGVDIQLRLGVSASCVAEQRRRYARDLKSRGKAPLLPPGGGESYSGIKLSRAKKAEVEALFMTGLGTLKVSEQTDASKTSCTRIRNRLIARLKRKGETLPGCDDKGVRHIHAESSRFITDEQRALVRAALLDRMPVRRAANHFAVGHSSAYRIRDELCEELAARGKALPKPILPGRCRDAKPASVWPPVGHEQIYSFRALLRDLCFDDARAKWCAERRGELEAEKARPKSFDEQLQRVRSGEIGITSVAPRAHLQPRQSAYAVATH